MTVDEVRKSGRKALVGKRPMTRVGRAVEKGETQGFMKVVVDAETERDPRRGDPRGRRRRGHPRHPRHHDGEDALHRDLAHHAHPPDGQRAGADDAPGAEAAELATRHRVQLPGDVARRGVRGGCTVRDIGRVDFVGSRRRRSARPRRARSPAGSGRARCRRELFQPGAQTEVYPMHVVLGGEHRQRYQALQFVAALGSGVGESRRDLVSPGAIQAAPPVRSANA